MEKLKRWLRAIAEQHQRSLLSNIIKHDKDEYEANVRHNFEAAKKISDFIGMIVRYAFSQAAFMYFLHKASELGGIRGFVLGFCSVSALALTVSLGVRIFLIILLYEAREVHSSHRHFERVFFFVLAILHAAALWYGTVTLVRDVAAAGLKP